MFCSAAASVPKCVIGDDVCVAKSITHMIWNSNGSCIIIVVFSEIYSGHKYLIKITILVYPELKIPKLDPYTPAENWILRTRTTNLPIKFNINASKVKISGFKQIIVNQFAWVRISIWMKNTNKLKCVKSFFFYFVNFSIVTFDQISEIPKSRRKYLSRR